MKKTLIAISPILLLVLFPPAASAKRGPKDAAGSPAQDLEPYINHLDQLLAAKPKAAGKGTPLANQAPGRIAVLKASYTARRAKAEGAEAARLTAAIATCDALTRALDERQRTVGQMKANLAINSSETLGRRRKDNFSDGTEGGRLARAVDTAAQARRERADNRDIKQRANATEHEMDARSLERWNQRAIELRKQITAAYSRIG